MIQIQSIDATLIQKNPLTWGIISNIFSPDLQNDLVKFYPKEGFNQCVRNEGPQKHYSFGLLNAVLKNQILDDIFHKLDECWIKIIYSLLSEEYKKSISDKLDINLNNTTVNIGFYKFDKNDWVSPHVDNEDKVLTQIFYFNQFWDINWGGHLKILGAQDPDNVLFLLPPLSNFSALIARSERAWHMVTPVTENAQACRLSMQLEFIKEH